YLDEPPMAMMLLAREVPPTGGDTMFADMYAAYDTLSPAMRAMLEPLRAVNSSALADVSKTREDRIRELGADDDVPLYEAIHPVVRTHPETGRKALYVNVAHTARFDGMTEEESRPLLQFLFHHQVRPELTCRFQWRVGSLAMWDNRCAQHNPVNDYHGWTRRMLRITLQGDRPKGEQ
ncbi:MAG: TauD/TfdA dioxygenase family protein, partial [Acidimicrobiales bacterium]